MSSDEMLNSMQQEAVYHTEGPLLILAGAGSGKTRVLTNRTAYLIEEKGVSPFRILAITFTNKAAGEMRDRIQKMVGMGSEAIWVSTFHSACVRILRRYIELLGYHSNFTIYDTDDQKTVMKSVCKTLNIDTKQYKEKVFLDEISHAKDEVISPEEFALQVAGDSSKKYHAKVYQEYQKTLRQNNALDFDDLIIKTIELFKSHPEVLEQYQERFQYIMVDEYQDTNTAQFQLIQLLAGKYKNLCVVGDDDQSIYKFRGANIYNILNFEKEFPDARVIKLEQNYRSTGNILEAANAVIAHNVGRKEKSLWTENETGAGIQFHQFDTAFDEADYIVKDLRRKIGDSQYQYKDCAILYRTNAQSRLLEERLVMSNIPYKIFGGVNFYARKEIKDVLAYLKTIANARDDVAVHRIINVPKRGIGATTITRVQTYAVENEISFYRALQMVEDIPGLKRSAGKIKTFVELIQTMRSKVSSISLVQLMEEILEETGYFQELKAEGDIEAKGRMENIDEFISKAATYEEKCRENDVKPSLEGFLEEVALITDLDSLEEESNYVVLMTLHSAKGLEFPNVYLVGLEDGIFPSYMSITSGKEEDLEEERRLCYVGITRAMKQLNITGAKMRMIRGEVQYHRISRFVQEIPKKLLGKNSPKQESFQEYKSLSPKSIFNTTPTYYMEPVNFSGNANKNNSLEYGVGDRVQHLKFGEGTVTNIVSGGRDFEVTVEFDEYGTKKMFSIFAKLKKIEK